MHGLFPETPAKPMVLRQYQTDAVEAVWGWLRDREDNPCIVIPTGGGKTPVIAEICRQAVMQWNGRVLILAHVKELLEQTCEKLHHVFPEVDYGVYSAGLKRRDTKNPVIVAGIQSVYKRACELDSFDLIMIDESHLIPPDGEGMYRTFLQDAAIVNPQVRLIGLTATPYRMKSGLICGPDNLLNGVCYEIGVRDLIDQGYLCELVGKASVTKVDTSRLHIVGGEFVANEMEQMYAVPVVVESACREIVAYGRERNGVLVFTSGVRHCDMVADELSKQTGERVEIITGETPMLERSAIVQAFKNQEFRYLVNVNVLTTGFDAAHIDMVAILRATMSPGLYYQMCGRGFRPHPGKENCLLLDFGANVLRHGPVDVLNKRQNLPKKPNDATLVKARECPECMGYSDPEAECCEHCGFKFPAFWKTCEHCGELTRKGLPECSECGFVFPEPEPIINHDAQADEEEPLSKRGGIVFDDWVNVKDITYDVHHKKGAPPDAPRTLRVDYWYGIHDKISEWVCLEHDGFARAKACRWWYDRTKSSDVPKRVEDAVALANSGYLANATEIRIVEKSGERFPRIAEYKLADVPEDPPQPVQVFEVDPYDPYGDGVPF